MPDTIYFTTDCDFVGIFEQFHREWNRPFFHHVIKEVPNFDDDLAQDICQQIWTEVWQAVTTRKYTYLTPGLLVYKADSRIKDHVRRAARFAQLDPAKHDRADGLNVDERIDHKTALAAIPESERNIFVLFFREGFTQDEIAARLTISSRTVRRKLNAALTHLKEFLRCAAATTGSSRAK